MPRYICIELIFLDATVLSNGLNVSNQLEILAIEKVTVFDTFRLLCNDK